eukprot:scaffold367228_cov41-Attheya_sp.AAC.2
MMKKRSMLRHHVVVVVGCLVGSLVGGWIPQSDLFVGAFGGASFGSFLSTTRPSIIEVSKPRRRSDDGTTRLFESKSSSSTKEERDTISDVDARVLQSILQDEDKFDVASKDNARRILETTRVAPDPLFSSTDDELSSDEKKKEEFSSTILKTLNDNVFWRVVEDVVESAKVFVLNRVERDSKLLASIGLFAWDRARADFSRALPSSSTSTPDFLTRNGYRNRPKQLGEYKTNTTNTLSTRFLSDQTNYKSDWFEEFNTPMDEIRRVTEAIGDILNGVSTSSSSSSSSSSSAATNPRRGLKTVASGGRSTINGGEDRDGRQARAYQRRKQALQREEKEPFNVGRMAAGMTDAAFELKRELQVETSEPGYRTEPIRNAIASGISATAALGEASARRRLGERLFGSNQEETDENEVWNLKEAEAPTTFDESSSSSSSRSLFTANDLRAERVRLAAELRFCLQSPELSWLAPDVLMQRQAETPAFTVDDKALSDVITNMVCTRDDLDARLAVTSNNNDNNPEEEEDVMQELRNLQNSIQNIRARAAMAAGYQAANLLYSELMGRGNNNSADATTTATNTLDEGVSILELLDTPVLLEEEEETIITEEIQEVATLPDPIKPIEPTIMKATPVVEVKVEPIRPVILDAEVEPSSSSVGADDELTAPSPSFRDISFFANAVDAPLDAQVVEENDNVIHDQEESRNVVLVEEEDTEEEDMNMLVTATELVSDDEYDETVFKSVKTVLEVEEDDDDDAQKENAITLVTLRALDIVFFVAEKALTKGIPAIYTTGRTVTTRLQKVQRNGLGSEGWEPLENAQDGSKRY